MTLAEVKNSVDLLPLEERRDLMIHLRLLEERESKEFLEMITRRRDETDKHVKWEDVKAELDASESGFRGAVGSFPA